MTDKEISNATPQELNKLIPTEVMKWKLFGGGWVDDQGCWQREDDWNPATDHNDAFDLLGLKYEFFLYEIKQQGRNTYCCTIHFANPYRTIRGYGETVPVAICRACLLVYFHEPPIPIPDNPRPLNEAKRWNFETEQWETAVHRGYCKHYNPDTRVKYKIIEGKCANCGKDV